MKERLALIVSILVVCMAVLFGCGSSGSNTSNEVSGIVSKGPINGAIVFVNALSADGTVGRLLATGYTAADGTYIINIGNYTGNLIILAQGGSYIDEATGILNNNNSTFRAVKDAVAADIVINVTPYTEIAVRYAPSLSTQNIKAANSLISNMLGGIDIISTLPADILDPSSKYASLSEKEYGIMLGAISYMVNNGAAMSVDDAITLLINDLANRMLDTTGAALSIAVANCVGDTSSITGVTLATISVDEVIQAATVTEIVAEAVEEPAPEPEPEEEPTEEPEPGPEPEAEPEPEPEPEPEAEPEPGIII